MVKKGIRDFYDKTAKEWADRFYEGDENLPLLKDFMSSLPPGPRVLDLCCGAGYDSMRLAKMGADMVGIDLSEASIAIAREKNPGIPFYVGDMLEDYRYIGLTDAIVCLAGIVHLPTDKLPAAFRRMRDVLKPGGSLLLAVRDGTGRVDRMSDVVVDGEEYDRSFYAHNLDELKESSDGLFLLDRVIEDPEESVWVNYVFKAV